VHQAELRLEVCQHNKQLAQDEADDAAAGQAPLVGGYGAKGHLMWFLACVKSAVIGTCGFRRSKVM
jgi:hypothetical protein